MALWINRERYITDMVLNNKPQMFTIGFPDNFFYKEVCEKWNPIVERMKLPYQNVTDFMNAQIQSVDFPGVPMDIAEQQRGQYEVAYAGGKELEPLVDKKLDINFKLTESYISYWIVWDQVDLYLHYRREGFDDKKPIWMEPISLTFLSDAGFQLTQFKFNEIVPTNIGSLKLSYAATVASYNTFVWSLHYNNFDVK